MLVWPLSPLGCCSLCPGYYFVLILTAYALIFLIFSPPFVIEFTEIQSSKRTNYRQKAAAAKKVQSATPAQVPAPTTTSPRPEEAPRAKKPRTSAGAEPDVDPTAIENDDEVEDDLEEDEEPADVEEEVEDEEEGDEDDGESAQDDDETEDALIEDEALDPDEDEALGDAESD